MARSSEWARWADQRFGRLVARALARSGERPAPSAPERILFVQPTAIGDTLISSGAVAALSRRHPRAEIVVAHGPSNAAAVKMLAADARGVAIGFGNPVKAARALRALKPDMVIDLCPWPFATALATRLSGAWTAGFQPSFGNRGALFDRAVPHRTNQHEIENLSALSEALDAGPAARMAIAPPQTPVPEWIDTSRLVLLHAAAGGSRAAPKSWPTDHWAALVRALVARGWSVGLTGVPADAAVVDPIIAAAAAPPEKVVSFCGKLSLAELVAVLAKAPLLISVDTGVLHLSAAVDGVAIGLHGPTRAKRWGTVSPNGAGLDAPHPAAGYINYGWESHPEELEIMRALAPETVVAEADRLLAVPASP
ncbi:MAG: glycosyltransferase family 9 protein [Pseudomonadota bacterium]